MTGGAPFRIVVGVDGTDGSPDALAWAAREAALRGGELTAVFAWQMPLVGVPGAFDHDELEREAHGVLAAKLAAVELPDGIPVTQVAAEGETVESLVAACERVGADLLVVGSRPRNGTGRLIFGSVALACVANAPCDVLVIKGATG
jgi:nucleotide-binding universal stress UspA family protein